jgi:acyl carrier protein
MGWATIALCICALAFWAFWRRSNAPDPRYEHAPITDEEYLAKYFPSGDVPPSIALTMRRIFAEQFQYPSVDIVYADDDYTEDFAELDCYELVLEIEEAFGVSIPSDWDCGFTIEQVTRSVAALVAKGGAASSGA